MKVVEPNLKNGATVRIAKMEVYYNSSSIVGLATEYEIKDYTGKISKVTETHKPAKVSASKAKFVFKPADCIARVEGKTLMTIKKLRVILASGQVAINCGKDEGGEFYAYPPHKGPVVAFAGSMADALYTLRAYAQIPS